MNLLEQKEILKHTYQGNNKNIHLNKIIFNTKDEFNNKLKIKENLLEKEIYDIIIKLTFSELDNEKLLLDLYNKVEQINKSKRNNILINMISVGYGDSYNFSKNFNINIKIDKKFFIKAIQETGENLILHPEFENYLNLYENPKELFIYVLKEGFIDIYFYLTGESSKKISNNDIEEGIKKLYNIFKYYDLEDKLSIIGENNWFEIFEAISNKPNEHLKSIQNFLYLNEQEKKEFDAQKTIKYKNNFEKTIKNREIENKENGFNLEKNYLFDKVNCNEKIIHEIIRTINFSNSDSEFIIEFDSILNRNDYIIITNNPDNYDNIDYVYTKSKYLKNLENLFNLYYYDFKNSGIDFNIGLYKYNFNGPKGGKYNYLKNAA